MQQQIAQEWTTKSKLDVTLTFREIFIVERKQKKKPAICAGWRDSRNMHTKACSFLRFRYLDSEKLPQTWT
eukprot:5642367-Pleurochrysis_carterae.AAC.5